MLKIKNLQAKVEDTEILKGVDLEINPGEVHVIMGLNGSGKSTLANVLAGREEYEVTSGSIEFKGQDLLDMEVDQRANSGLFLAMQYPVELPGISGQYFLLNAYNAKMKHLGKDPIKVTDFNKMINTHMENLKLDRSFLLRSVNEGFSGGEKKKNEILQMSVLNPDLAILDETDSGLDIDALKVVSNGVNLLKEADNKKSFLIITHYQRILDYIKPDVVHIMIDGKIVKTGDMELVKQLEENGYEAVVN